MFKKIIASFLILSCSLIVGTPTFAATSQQPITTTRLSGQTRFETAKAISEQYNQGKVQNVILSTGNGFADALSASVLAHQKEAPIMLVDAAVDGSKDAFDYITQHLDPAGTVYIIGGTGVIGKEFETRLNTLGFNNMVRIAGYDRYETSYQVARSLNNTPISTVVISSGESYPDALSISSFAANKGWPVLLTSKTALSPKIKEYLQENIPTKVFITGGTGVISDNVAAEIAGLLPLAQIERLAGSSRFESNAIISGVFSQAPANIFLATGYGFADALAGSILAAKAGDPILLIDPNAPKLSPSTASYLSELYAKNVCPNLIAFGGSAVVPDAVIQNVSDLLTGVAKVDTNSTVSKMTSNRIVAPFSPTDIFFFALPDWNNKDDLAVAQKTHATVVGSAHQDNNWRLQKFFNNSELLSEVTAIAHQAGLKYTAQFTSDITDESFPNESEVAVKDIDGNIIYASMFTETPHVWKSIHYPQWKSYLTDLTKKVVDSRVDLICIDTWTLNHDVVGNKGGDFSENSLSGFRNYLTNKYGMEQLRGFGIDNINTFNYGEYIKNNYLDLYKSEDKWKTPLFKEFLDFQLISSKNFWQDIVKETQKHAESNEKKVLFTVNVPENKHREMVPGLAIVDTIEGFMSEYHYELPPYNNTITEYKVFRSLGKPVSYLPNCGDSTELLSRTDLAELMKIYTAEAYASGEFTYAPYAELANSPAGWKLYSADMNKLYPYYDFIANNKTYYDNLVSTAKTAVLYSYASVKNYLPANDNFFGISNLLLDSHHQYDVIFAGDNQWIVDQLTLDELNNFNVVIMPNVKDISDKQLDLLLTYVKNGGKVLAFGETGSRDESDRPKQRTQLNDLLVEGTHSYGKGQFVYIKDDVGTKYSVNRDENIRQEIAIKLNELSREDIQTSASKNVSMIGYMNNEGPEVIHMINYDYDVNAQHINQHNNFEMQVQLNKKLLGKELGVYYSSPDWEGVKELNYTIRNSIISFQVPRLDTYGVICIKEENRS